jgi:hypothetical protein
MKLARQRDQQSFSLLGFAILSRFSLVALAVFYDYGGLAAI